MNTELSERLAKIDAEIKQCSIGHRMEAKEWRDKVDKLLDERLALANEKKT